MGLKQPRSGSAAEIFLAYLKHSDCSIRLSLNPFTWYRNSLNCYWGASDRDPGLICSIRIRFLFIAVILYVDDGRW